MPPFQVLLRKTLFRLALTPRCEQRRLLCADYWIILGFLVDFEPSKIFLGYRHIRKDRLHRAFRDARVAIDAGVRVNKKPVRQFVKRFNGANCGTVGVFTFDARLGNDIGHWGSELS